MVLDDITKSEKFAFEDNLKKPEETTIPSSSAAATTTILIEKQQQHKLITLIQEQEQKSPMDSPMTDSGAGGLLTDNTSAGGTSMSGSVGKTFLYSPILENFKEVEEKKRKEEKENIKEEEEEEKQSG